MAIASCPQCASKLKVPDGTTAAVRCPKCKAVFKQTPPQSAFEVVDEVPAPNPVPRPATPVPKPADDFEVVDEKPSAKKVIAKYDRDDADDDRPRKKRSRDDDDADDDRPRKKRSRDDDDDRPRGKKRRDDDDEGDDEDDRPRKKKKRSRRDDDYDYSPPGKASQFGVARIGVLLLLISLGLYAGSMGLQMLFILIALIGGVIPSGLSLVTGLLGLANWVVGLVGLGMCIAGPSRARGLAIAALSVAAVHLILAFIVVNDSDSLLGSNLAVPLLSGLNREENKQSLNKELQKEEQKNPGSARAKELREDLKSYQDDGGFSIGEGSSRSKMRWGDLDTQLPFLDKLIAILSYQSKGFSKCLLGLFCGLAELGRLIVMAILIGSLASAARASGAASKAKLGWIVAASAAGVSMLVMLLCFAIADGSGKDAAKASSPNIPPQPNTLGMSFEQQRKAQEDWQKQYEAEFEKVREKQTSAIRAPFRWLAIGEFLVLLLHAGSIAIPAFAALQVYSATKRAGGRGRSREFDEDDD